MALLPINLIKLHRLRNDHNLARQHESLRLINLPDGNGG
jgi:hypothetical protein